ncbi:HXXEE domain-containing protein [Pseudoprimorskyibacter insulae]|uniref:Uncharacterized protein n=1 Tax=Pseudoprimorskyibacter insulae TaxID=1695997 RepID=A0A2R8AWD6_9RHOB|nr:HXXEE domain-containing protein [Pseudoprimorskyibacter insulae]SPF80189.1 hypothetical protein PRI8871_01995 [Pseudoprimorskyibacter insulae]
MQPRAAFALLLCAMCIKNIEEIMFLPEWGDTNNFFIQMSTAQVILAATILTVVFAVIGLKTADKTVWPLALITGSLMASALANLILSVIQFELMPGVLGGVLFLIPAAVLVFRSLDFTIGRSSLYTLAGLPFALTSGYLALALSGFLVN